MSKETGGAAFPSHEAGIMDPRNQISGGGMTLRDYFAAKAMQIVAQDDSWHENQYTPKDGLSFMENNARLAYQIADAMLAERAK